MRTRADITHFKEVVNVVVMSEPPDGFDSWDAYVCSIDDADFPAEVRTNIEYWTFVKTAKSTGCPVLCHILGQGFLEGDLAARIENDLEETNRPEQPKPKPKPAARASSGVAGRFKVVAEQGVSDLFATPSFGDMCMKAGR